MTDQRGNFCPEHSPQGFTCSCDEDTDRAKGIHRPSGIANAFGGYMCVCGGTWLSRMRVCLPPDEDEEEA